jgi:hypothetical protein
MREPASRHGQPSLRMSCLGFVTLGLLAVSCTSGGSTSPGSPSSTGPGSNAPDPACGPAGTGRAADCHGLLDAVRRRGSLGVVVTLAVPFTPEGRLSREQIERQRRAIAEAQTRLLDELGRFQTRLTTRFDSTPQLVLVVDEAALRHLLASPRVRHIQENAPQPPGG